MKSTLESLLCFFVILYILQFILFIFQFWTYGTLFTKVTEKALFSSLMGSLLGVIFTRIALGYLG